MTALAAAAPAPPPLIEVIHNLLVVAWRRRYLIGVPLLVLPVLGFLIGSFVPRSYETHMSILFQEPGRLNPFLEDISVKTNLKDRMLALQALLDSRYVLLPVAEDLGMVAKDAPPEAQSQVVAALGQSVTATLIGSEMVSLTYRGRHPRGMAQTLSKIGERFIDRVKAPEDSSMRQSVAFLRGQLSDATSRLATAERALSDFRGRNADRLPDLRAANVQRLTALREQVAEREVALAGAEAEIKDMSARLAQTDPVMGQLEQDIVATRSELALLRARYTDKHSRVQAAERRLVHLLEERTDLLAHPSADPADDGRAWNMASAAAARPDGTYPLLVAQAAAFEKSRLRVAQLKSEVRNLNDTIASLQMRVSQSGEIARELADREREVQVAGELVTQLRKRFDMAKVTGALSSYQEPERIAIIDRPEEPTRPTKPMALLFTLGGLFAGLALGIGLAALVELADTSVRSTRMLRELTGVPVLARVGPLEAKWI